MVRIGMDGMVVMAEDIMASPQNQRSGDLAMEIWGF
jgi:hypothetical protein